MKPIFFETPRANVTIFEYDDRHANFFDVFEGAAVTGLLLQRAVEAFGDEGEAWRDALELDIVGHFETIDEPS